MVFVIIIAIIVLYYLIKFGIQTHDLNVEEAKIKAKEQQAAAEAAARAEKKAARVEHFRDHPLMESIVESICKRMPDDVEKAKATYDRYRVGIVFESGKIGIKDNNYGNCSGTLVDFYKQGYKSMNKEDAEAFAEALKENLEPKTNKLGIIISESDNGFGAIEVILDFSSYCKQRKDL